MSEELDRFAALERAETRLDAHARQRSQWRARRARWRAIRAWVLALLVVPAAAAAGFVGVLETAGGDLGAWSPASATALVMGAFLGPAALSQPGSHGRLAAMRPLPWRSARCRSRSRSSSAWRSSRWATGRAERRAPGALAAIRRPLPVGTRGQRWVRSIAKFVGQRLSRQPILDEAGSLGPRPRRAPTEAAGHT